MAYLPNEDRLTKALNIIEWEHHMVHKGLDRSFLPLVLLQPL